MKITSITLTNELEIGKKRGIFDPGARRTPIYQVEYEESTKTGLKVTGTTLLSNDLEEKMMKFFSELASDVEKELCPKQEAASYNTIFEDDKEVKEDDDLDVIIYKISQRAIKDHEDKKAEQMRIALQGISITTTKLL